MLEFLKEKGNALKNFFDKKKDEDYTMYRASPSSDSEDEEIDTTMYRASPETIVDKTVKIIEAQQDYKPTEEQKKLGKTEDIGEMETIKDVLRKEEAEKAEKKEKGLDDKLKDIEKVLSTFGSGQEKLGSPPKSPFKEKPFELNKAIDFRTSAAKDFVAPYLQQPSSQGDRITLLIEGLKKQNLI